MEKATERHAGDSRSQLSVRLAGRGNRTPQGGLVHSFLTPALTAEASGRRNSRPAGFLTAAGLLPDGVLSREGLEVVRCLKLPRHEPATIDRALSNHRQTG